MEQHTTDNFPRLIHIGMKCSNGEHLVHLVTSVGSLKPVSLRRGLTLRRMTRVERDRVESTHEHVAPKVPSRFRPIPATTSRNVLPLAMVIDFGVVLDVWIVQRAALAFE